MKKEDHTKIYLEYICSRFDKVRPVVLHIRVILPKKPPTPKNIGEDLKVHQIKLWKEALFVQYKKNKNVSLLLDTISIKIFPKGKKVLRQSLTLELSMLTILMHGNVLHTTVKM